MFYRIAHRGNINGPQKNENNPEYVLKAINKGFQSEVDVRFENGNFFLGHDFPKYKTTLDFLKNDNLWCHAKNIEALRLMLTNNIHCFWHENDKYTITSRGYIWTFPGEKLSKLSICLFPEKRDEEYQECLGVCSDYIGDIE